MKQIFLSQGKIALVDNEDFKKINQFKWCINNKGYATRTDHKGCKQHKFCKRILMHRLIMNVLHISSKITQVDHIDGNKLDNQKTNLRLASNSQNQYNRGKQKNNTSGFKGVSFTKGKYHSLKPWQAKIHVNKKTIYLGVFGSKEEAALAYDVASTKYFGKFAKLNFSGGRTL